MRRCIIHIGTHKTGSTSLQRFFRGNAKVLESAGILYPTERPEVAHHNLFREITGKPPDGRRATTLERLSERLRRTEADVAILSSELFSTLGQDSGGPRRIAEIACTHGFQVEAVLFVRPQHVLFNSMYTQRTKMLAERHRFHDYAERQQRRKNFDFGALSECWIAAPFAALTAIPFTRTVIGPGIDAAFFDALGLSDRIASLARLAPLEAVNFANGPKGVELCRRLSELGGPRHFGRTYLNVRRFAQREAHRRDWNRISFVGLTDQLRDRLFDHYAGSNETFARRHWGTSWQSVFSADYERRFVPNEIGTAETAPEKISEVGEVFEIARNRFDPTRLAKQPFAVRIAAELSMRIGNIVGSLHEQR